MKWEFSRRALGCPWRAVSSREPRAPTLQHLLCTLLCGVLCGSGTPLPKSKFMSPFRRSPPRWRQCLIPAPRSWWGDQGPGSVVPVDEWTSLPAPMFSRSDFSVWTILKKCVGLELSKITMPIAFNEPLSFLQRITEYMEHVYLIHRASCQPQPLERMQSVAAFAVSAVASQWERTGKPFNPLLGETYELIREDLGFRFISEQVSHHPPISAFHSEGLNHDFLFHGSIYPKLKFWGKSVEAEPRGTITLELLKHNEAYTWTNPTCCVHNVIIGKLWIEQYGTVEILNHRTGHKCVLHFKPCGLFGKELHKVEGHIQDKNKKKLFMIYGKWTECLWGIDPVSYESFKKQERRGDHLRKAKLGVESLKPPHRSHFLMGAKLRYLESSQSQNLPSGEAPCV
nr:oxysterol-binding protein-related protein 2 isoform X4 [Pan troglodytes]